MDTLKGLGIAIEQSIPHQHQQNGQAKRAIRTIMEKVQCLCFTVCLSQSWWKFCINHAVYLINWTPITCLSWLMPMESLIKVKLDLSKLHIFGCGAYVFLPKEVRANKLTPKLELMTYIGYETGVKGWKFMWPSGTIFTRAMATFDETIFPCCPGAKTPARMNLSETPDLEGHIPHRMPDGGLMPPGPSSSDTLSVDNWTDNHGNEGLDYPGDLDNKSSESSPLSMRPPSCSASPPPWHPKKAGLPHLSEVRHDMDEWNRLPWRSSHERNITRCPGNIYSKTCPPQRLRGTSCMISIGKR